MKSAVIVFPGSNCDRDLAVALEQVTGRKPAMVWHRDRALPDGVEFIGLPGGFSYGDYLRSGAMAARSPIMRAVTDAAQRGGHGHHGELQRHGGHEPEQVARGLAPGGDVGARFRATNDWAVRNGFAGGFPNFHQADYGQGTVYGTILFRHGRIQWRDVFADVLGIFSRFTFDANIT